MLLSRKTFTFLLLSVKTDTTIQTLWFGCLFLYFYYRPCTRENIVVFSIYMYTLLLQETKLSTGQKQALHMAQNGNIKNGGMFDVSISTAWMMQLMFHVENVLHIQTKKKKKALCGSRFDYILNSRALTIFCLIFSTHPLTRRTESLSGSSRFFWKVL